MDFKPPLKYVHLNFTVSQCSVDNQLAYYCKGDPQAQKSKNYDMKQLVTCATEENIFRINII